MRRSLATTLLSGLVGWLAGTGLSLLIASGDPDAPGFGRNVWVFSVVFTRSAAVWVELLAKPGSLARAQQGLVKVPRPLRALRRSSQRVRRYGQITGIAVKHGFGPVLGLGGRAGQGGSEPGRLPPAVRLRRALEEGGGMFVKLGQILSTRSDLLPASVVAELSKLRDKVPPADPAAVRALIEAELGAVADDLFAEFDWEPLAAASIGQAHRARLKDGKAVIVKVLRPGIGEAVERDLLVLDELVRTVEARTTWGAEYRVSELAAEFGERLREELDLRREAGNASAVAANLAELPEVRTRATSWCCATAAWD